VTRSNRIRVAGQVLLLLLLAAGVVLVGLYAHALGAGAWVENTGVFPPLVPVGSGLHLPLEGGR
jgi:hypothetical protein